MTRNRKNSFTKICSICEKASVSSYNRPNSLHKTKRQVHPNLQTINKELMCAKCLKSKYKSIGKSKKTV